MSYRDAAKCFSENIRLTGGAQADPISFNLYNGLRMLTEQMERDIYHLQKKVAELETRR